MLRSKIFVHTNRQLQASHFILRCTLEYKTWQPFSQALSVDNPLLSYIDVRHANFLCPSLTIGEAQDLNLRCTTAEDLAPIKDELAERVSWAFREQEHIPVEGNVGQAQAAEQEVAEVEQEAEIQLLTISSTSASTCQGLYSSSSSFIRLTEKEIARRGPTTQSYK